MNPTTPTIEKLILEELKSKSDVIINDSLWYVNPKDVLSALTQQREQYAKEIEKTEEYYRDKGYAEGYSEGLEDGKKEEREHIAGEVEKLYEYNRVRNDYEVGYENALDQVLTLLQTSPRT